MRQTCNQDMCRRCCCTCHPQPLCSMRVTTSDNGITNAIEIYRTPAGQVGGRQAAAGMLH